MLFQSYMLTNRERPAMGPDWFYVYYTRLPQNSFWVERKVGVHFGGKYICFLERIAWGWAMPSFPHTCIWKGKIVVISVSTQNSISDSGLRVHVWDDLGCLLFIPTDLMSTWKSKNLWSSIDVFFSFATWFFHPSVNPNWFVFLRYICSL